MSEKNSISSQENKKTKKTENSKKTSAKTEQKKRASKTSKTEAKNSTKAVKTPSSRKTVRKGTKKSAEKSAKKSANASMKVYFLGGLNEIGKNLTVFECRGDMIIVDCGMSFPSDDMLGVDLVLPDYTFIRENAQKIKGIFFWYNDFFH